MSHRTRRFARLIFFEETAEMLHKCANPICLKRFRHLDEGKLFQVETECLPVSTSPRSASASRRGRVTRQVERYWLCDDCSVVLTLTFEKGRGVVPIPLVTPIKRDASPSIDMVKLQAVLHKARPTSSTIRQSA
jgi:hypothetical protein